jgi:S-formylglutathione hydrolase FrmB
VHRTIVVVFALLACFLTPIAVQAADGLSFHTASGLRVVHVTRIDQRQYDVAVSTPALGRTVHVRVLVPANYRDTRERLPVLYLFHGTSGRASDWVNQGNAEKATAGLGLIVVMPDAGFDGDGGGWFTNWVDMKTALGPSQWETFHVEQLIPWVDANLRTVATRNGRAIAGLSQGGFGSMTYAARHPDLFVSAAAFSGAPDVDYNPILAAGATGVIEATAVGLDGVEPDAMFGSRATNEINWQGHDPADLVDNLRSVDVWLFTATGQPGPYDSGPPNLTTSGIEFATHESTAGFVQRAQQEGVPFHLVDYTYGTHTWPYWARDLVEYLPHAMELFARPSGGPPRVSFESIDSTWSQWGWSVVLRRTGGPQFSALMGAGPAGFTLRGTGTAIVTTPASYKPQSGAVVRISGRPPMAVTADSAGRLEITVPLGLDVPDPAILGVPVVLGPAVAVSIAPR